MSEIKYKTFEYNKLINGININGLPSVDNLGSSSNAYNFSYFNNKIKDGFGINNYNVELNGKITPLVFPNNIIAKKMYTINFKDQDLSSLIIVGHNMHAYMWTFSSNSPDVIQFGFTLDCIPSVFSYVDDNNIPCVCFSHNGKIACYHIDGTDDVDFLSNTYNVTQISFLDDRVVGLLNDDCYAFWYSISQKPSDWSMTSEFCHVQNVDMLLGKCLQIFKMEENLYLVREYGIQRLVFDPENLVYQVQNVGQSIGRIFSESICQNGAKIIYLTTSGLYEFNGSTSKKITTNVDHILAKYNNSPTVCQNGIYYIATNYNLDTQTIGDEAVEHTNNLLICINLESKVETIFRGVDVIQLVAINTSFLTDIALMVHHNGENRISRLSDECKLFGLDLKKHWSSVPTDFAMPSKKKTITRFFLTTKQDITLTLTCDNKSYKIDLEGSDNVQVVRPNLSGYTFSFSIDTTQSNNEIFGLKVLVAYNSD